MDLTSTVTSRKKAEEQKAEFLEILQQKLKENISTKDESKTHAKEGGVVKNFDNMKLSREKKVSTTEPVYGEVLTKTLQQYGQQKLRRRQSLAKGTTNYYIFFLLFNLHRQTWSTLRFKPGLPDSLTITKSTNM